MFNKKMIINFNVHYLTSIQAESPNEMARLKDLGLLFFYFFLFYNPNMLLYNFTVGRSSR